MRTLKANLKLEGKPCGWCQAPLALGDDAAVCTACEAAHHQGCWDTKAGCATHGCTSAPLRRLDA
ncbi:MAG TPA: RING finger protein, partial [Kofleriaceae bacterium]